MTTPQPLAAPPATPAAPLSSMTAFARAAGTSGPWRFAWELRSVNGKALDVRLRVPAGFDEVEARARAQVGQALARGSVSASLSANREGETVTARVNRSALAALYRTAAETAAALSAPPPGLDALLAAKGIVEVVELEIGEAERTALAEAVLAAFHEGLVGLGAMRAREGEALRQVLAERLGRIEALVDAAEAVLLAEDAAARTAAGAAFGEALFALSGGAGGARWGLVWLAGQQETADAAAQLFRDACNRAAPPRGLLGSKALLMLDRWSAAIAARMASVGRGTDTPFEVVGAPYIDDVRLAQELNHAALPGISFVPIRFTPTASVHQGRNCGGVYLMLNDRERCNVVDVGLLIARTVYRLYPSEFDPGKIKNLLLHDATLAAIKADKPLDEIRATWRMDLVDFQQRRERYLIYQ